MTAPSKSRTVRFAQVVKQGGKPRVHTLWVAPEKDAELRKAEKAQRVMTLTDPAHGRAWMGEIGLNLDAKTAHQYLIFPKTLRAFVGAKIVGINLDALAEAPLVAAKSPRAAPKTKPKPKLKPAPPAARPPEVQPAPAHRKSAPSPAPPPAPASPKPPRVHTVPELVGAIRAALRDLQKGHTRAARRRLADAVGEDES